MKEKLNRRHFLRSSLLLLGGGTLAACQPKVVEQVVKETVVAKETIVVKETVIVEGEEQVVEKVITATPAPKEPVTLRWGSWAVGSEVFVSLADQFTERYPNVTVQQEAAPWAQYWDRLQVQMAAGEAPDIVWMSGATFLNFVEKGFFLDLTPRMEISDLALDDYFLQADVFTWNGRTYAWPWFHTVSSAWYNKELFDEAGLDYPPTDWDNTWSWTEFLDVAQKLTKTRDDGRQQYGVLVSNAFEQCWGSFVWSNGGDVINKELTETTMDTSEAIEGLGFVVDLVQEYGVAPEPGDPSAFIEGVPGPFEAGLCAMHIHSCAQTQTYSQIEAFTPGACCLPTAPDGVPACSFNGNPNSIASSSLHPDEAWDFITFLSSREGMEEMARQKLTMPANKEVARTLYVEPPPLNLSTFVDAMELEHCNDLRFHRLWLEWVNAIQAPVDLALTGEMTTEEACGQATADGNEVLSRV